MAGESPLTDDVLTVAELFEALKEVDPATPVLGVCGNLHVDGIASLVVSDDGVTLIPGFWLDAMDALGTLDILTGEDEGEEEADPDPVEVPEAR